MILVVCCRCCMLVPWVGGPLWLLGFKGERIDGLPGPSLSKHWASRVPWVSITPGSFLLTATDLSGTVKIPTSELGIYCKV